MAKRKRPQNLCKVDIREDLVEEGSILPVRIQQLSKDGRRIEQTIHSVPAPKHETRAPTFDPSPAYGAPQDCASLEECDLTAEPVGSGRVCLRPSPQRIF
jgi:hypothetical protein